MFRPTTNNPYLTIDEETVNAELAEIRAESGLPEHSTKSTD